MNINELRMGNYFSYYRTLFYVRSLGQEHVNNVCLAIDCDPVLISDFSKPVAEWWKTVEENNEAYQKKHPGTTMCDFEGIIIPTWPKYIHQLQNLHFCLFDYELNLEL